MEMRRLFRGKTSTGDWHFGLITIMRGQQHLINPNDENSAYAIMPETIGQCTGLKDKNDTLIFEGDILRCWKGFSDKKNQFRREYYKCLPVEYCRIWCAFVVVDNENKEQFTLNQFAAYEVVGNIHDGIEKICN